MISRWRELNINNVVQAVQSDPMYVLDFVQSIIDANDYDVPGEVLSKDSILASQKMQAYYANQHSYLMGLWGALRLAAKTDKMLIAARDVLEGQVSSAKLKYSASSRVLTAYETIQSDAGMRERTL